MWVRVARIGKPFGVKGLMTVQLFTDEPEQRLVPGAQLSLDDEGTRPVALASVQRMGTRWVVGIDGVDDRDDAEDMRGGQLYAQVATDGPTTGDDEWFDWQLIGLPCRTPGGVPLGDVVAVDHPPAHDILVVETAAGERVLVPFVSQIVPDITAAGVTIDPPGGLFETEERSD